MMSTKGKTESMELLFTSTQDQAILAKVIQEAHQKSTQSGGYLGRTAIQKIVYFLKVAGVSTSYRFDLYHYGPFSDDVRTDINWLLADGVIKDASLDTERYSDYQPGPALEVLLSKHGSTISQHEGLIKSVVQALPLTDPKRMELVATLDYVYRSERAKGGNGPWQEPVVKRFIEVKKDKFPESEIRQTYSLLVQGKLLAQ